jgi:hypothetical protein
LNWSSAQPVTLSRRVPSLRIRNFGKALLVTPLRQRNDSQKSTGPRRP